MKVLGKASIHVFAASLFILPSFAQDKPEWVSPLPDIVGDPAAGRTKAEPCATCHGPVGLSDHNYYPNIAGQKEEYLLYQLHYYRSGKRPHVLMTPLAEVLSDTDIADISAFYASIQVVQETAKEADGE
jgi:cytochrome c553